MFVCVCVCVCMCMCATSTTHTTRFYMQVSQNVRYWSQIGTMQVHKMNFGWSIQALHCLVAEWACLRTHRINYVNNVVGLGEILNVNHHGQLASLWGLLYYFLLWHITVNRLELICDVLLSMVIA